MINLKYCVWKEGMVEIHKVEDTGIDNCATGINEPRCCK